MQHTGNIMGFYLISSTCKLAQSDVDQFIIFVSKHGIQKLTLDMANEENYMLPNRIFTCATLTHLKLSRCFFSLQLEHSKIAGHRGSEDMINLPMLETLELRFCVGVDSVYLKLGSVRVPDKLCRPLKLQSLKICDFKISVESISCAFCLLHNSPNLYELEIDEVVKANETSRNSAKLLSYLSMEEDLVNEALKLIQTVRLRKFKGSSTEMCLISVLISHSKKIERMIIEQSDKGNVTSFKEQLRELLRCICRASPKAVKLDLLWHMEVVPLWMTKVCVQYW
ncbi:hypothetical protein KY290_026555 [Solanum tuberosum]|uniref:Ubiquitin-protein ligase n=1 Tax=Solanum tuberosum TaxID=4113 RepID=A0ABQ7UWS5_SOLTU|nr:hypothetical protein KY290_026555 [Solanum tuberosum]